MASEWFSTLCGTIFGIGFSLCTWLKATGIPLDFNTITLLLVLPCLAVFTTYLNLHHLTILYVRVADAYILNIARWSRSYLVSPLQWIIEPVRCYWPWQQLVKRPQSKMGDGGDVTAKFAVWSVLFGVRLDNFESKSWLTTVCETTVEKIFQRDNVIKDRWIIFFNITCRYSLRITRNFKDKRFYSIKKSFNFISTPILVKLKINRIYRDFIWTI